MSCTSKNKGVYLFRVCALLFEMPKYGVARGRQIGVFDTWKECQKQVEGFTGAKYKKFDTLQQAEDFIKEFNGSLVNLNEKPSNFTSSENKYSHTAVPVVKVSPSNVALNDLNKTVNMLETKLSTFMKHVTSTFDDLKKRISALEERKIIDNQTILLETENEEIMDNSSQRKGKKRKAATDYNFSDLNDDDFINLNYDDDNGSEDDNNKKKSERTCNQPNSTDPLPKQKGTKLKKCKILDEVDGYYGISQCIVNSKGFLVNPFGAVVAYTDGACSRNGKRNAKAGIGVWFNFNHPRNVSEPVRGRATNNNAEIQAATAAILQASKEGIRHLHIYTDSQFLINCITDWIYKWKRNDWKTIEGKPVINRVELTELDNYINELMDSVIWTYVKGHSGDIGNSAADELARQGALLYVGE